MIRHLARVVEGAGHLLSRHPAPVEHDRPAPELGAALGATLYTPGTQPDLAARLTRLGHRGLVASVLCLEDSVDEADVDAATANVTTALHQLLDEPDGTPLRFVRVRAPGALAPLVERLGAAVHAVDGFVLPKFGAETAADWLDELDACGLDIPFMPILEDRSILDQERRADTLRQLRDALDARRERVIAVRFGATDLAGILGLRRAADQTTYELPPILDCLVSVVNVFGRAPAYTIAGPVWEHYRVGERIWKPQLRESTFPAAVRPLRAAIIESGIEHLVRETRRDLATGLLGKSVIHPDHIAIVDACHVVTAEEHEDALDVLAREGGAWASPHGNKMNEAAPHREWARRTVRRAHDFGVLDERYTLADLLVEVAA